MATVPTTKPGNRIGMDKQKPPRRDEGARMDSALHQRESEPFALTADRTKRTANTDMGVHPRADVAPARLERPSKAKLPRELTWFAVQAVNLDPDNGSIQLRSFPFWTMSLEMARMELLEMGKKDPHGCPYTHIFQYAALHQASGKMSKCKLEKSMINIGTGVRR